MNQFSIHFAEQNTRTDREEFYHKYGSVSETMSITKGGNVTKA